MKQADKCSCRVSFLEEAIIITVITVIIVMLVIIVILGIIAPLFVFKSRILGLG